MAVRFCLLIRVPSLLASLDAFCVSQGFNAKPLRCFLRIFPVSYKLNCPLSGSNRGSVTVFGYFGVAAKVSLMLYPGSS